MLPSSSARRGPARVPAQARPQPRPACFHLPGADAAFASSLQPRCMPVFTPPGREGFLEGGGVTQAPRGSPVARGEGKKWL